MQPFLECSHLAKSYSEFSGHGPHHRKLVLKDVSFSLERGSVTGLIGMSGEGKSTLSRILLGLENPDSGTVLIEGENLNQWRAGHKGEMSVVFQNYTDSVNQYLTIEQILLDPCVALNKKLPDPKRMLESVGLTSELLKKRPYELSGGQLQRVCIARAMSIHPKFVIFDEAISSLDAAVQFEILELLQTLRTPDSVWLFITHDIEAGAFLCDKLLFMNGGIIAETLPSDNLSSAKTKDVRELLSHFL
jgi:ABC transporter related